MNSRTLKLAGLSLLIALPVFRIPASAAAPAILTVAIFDFDSKDEAVRDLGPKIATLVNASLSAESQIITVERADLEKVLGEQELALSGTVTPDTAAKVGHLTGAKVLVTGRVFKVEKELVLVAKIISTETGRVYGDVVKGNAAGTPITDMAAALAKKIATIITEKGDTLVAKFETIDERIEKIAKALGDAKRPAVSVKIAERHFGQPVIDPAAETEFALMLQRTGFTVVDAKSQQNPEIEITGEAFSALAMRKGNLISSKARVEIKVQEKKSGRILAQDRQISVAVDITEQTAAKTALQNAAAELAGRVLPKLVTK